LKEPSPEAMLPPFVQKRLGVTTALVVPLACRGRFLGGLWLDDTRSPHLFTSTDINVVQGIATELAIALNTSELVGKLDLERRRFEALVTALMDGLLIVDRDRRMVHLDSGAEALLGWQHSEIRGRRVSRAVHVREAAAAGGARRLLGCVPDGWQGGRAPLREEIHPPQGLGVDCRAAQHGPASFQVEAAQVPFRDESRVDVRLRVKPAIGRRRFLREDEELAATARTPKETGERIDDWFVDIRVAVQDEELSLAGEDLHECGRDGLVSVRVRGPLAGRVGERVRERLEVVTGLDLHPHRTRDALREGPAERALPHAAGSVYDRDGRRAGP